MSDHLYNQYNHSYDNPLEAYADELSQLLNSNSASLENTTAGNVEAGQVSMHQSAARSVDANALRMEESVAGMVRSASVEVHDSALGVVLAQEVTLENTTTPFLMAQRVKAQELQTVALLAGHVDGNVKAFLTPLTAFAMGAGFALTFVLLKTIVPRIVTKTSAS